MTAQIFQFPTPRRRVRIIGGPLVYIAAVAIGDRLDQRHISSAQYAASYGDALAAARAIAARLGLEVEIEVNPGCTGPGAAA